MAQPKSPLKIYELLPKKNCGGCGVKTCMAFALKLMEGSADPGECPYIEERERAGLESLVSPPVKRVTIRGRLRGITIGGERVLHRHELKFYNPTSISLELSDLEEREDLLRGLAAASSFSMERSGEVFRVEAIALREESGDGERFAEAAKLASEEFPGPIILYSYDPGVAVKALEGVEGTPLLYAATAGTLEEFIEAAFDRGCPLALESDDLGSLRGMVRRAVDRGVEVVLSPASPIGPPFKTLRNFIQARMGAILHGIEEFRYPLIGVPAAVWREPRDPEEGIIRESLTSSMLLMRYADMLIVKSRSVENLLPIYTLRQALYSDPRAPATVKPGLYTFGTPDERSPVLLTTNYALTFYMVSGDLHRSGISCYLIVLDTGGMSVLNALAGKLINPDMVRKYLEEHRLGELVKERRLIIPGGLSPLSGEIEEATGWSVTVGPGDSSELSRLLGRL
ncbi:MAG: acetyl-CoA decarbonylase/synthase complex subunit gamma [Candidatus Bathyarchaeia archaeon]|nr:acetyl-CoA decarbonylase/synthase complex subunit gamma [Candidatus Bathyarchaeota archaeon]